MCVCGSLDALKKPSGVVICARCGRPILKPPPPKRERP